MNETNNGNPAGVSTFYTETRKKAKTQQRGFIFQLALVSLISSIFGGILVGLFFTVTVPTMNPVVEGFISKAFPGYADRLKMLSSVEKTVADVRKIEIEKMDSPVAAIAEKVGPSIVGVRVTYKTRIFGFFVDEVGEAKEEGSGIIISPDGYIMTNYHVVERAFTNESASKIQVFLPNNEVFDAVKIGGDQKTDLAVIKINRQGLPAAELGNSDDLRVGELAVAIGNPLGIEFQGSVTVGYISALNRVLDLGNNQMLKLIQTDAAINPGNSGGALVNSQGQVIGVNTAKISMPGVEGLGFAIPINKAKNITSDLIEYKYVKGRPSLGIYEDTRYTASIAKRYGWPEGVYVRQVVPFSGADKAGIKEGDIIVKFDGKNVKNANDINDIKENYKPDDVIALEIYRDGKTLNINVKLGEER